MKNIEYKDFTGSVKDVDVKNRIITGFLTSSETEDRGKDIIRSGSAKKTIAENGNNIWFLNHHDWKQPHGKFAIVEERKEGIYFESNKLPNTSYSNDLIELYNNEIIKEHSIGFVTIKKSYQGETRIIEELKLYEGSNVTLGANPNTPFMGYKSATLKEVQAQSKLITKAFRDGTFTDETFQLLEIALKQLELQAYEIGKKTALKEKKEAVSNTSYTTLEPQIIINELLKFKI